MNHVDDTGGYTTDDIRESFGKVVGDLTEVAEDEEYILNREVIIC